MADGGASSRSDGPPPRLRTRIEIGLVNNMPDSALLATERQFGALIRAAAGPLDVRLRLYSLPGVARGEMARAAMEGRYEDATRLEASDLDALIVTGAEPKTADLRDEAYWPQMASLIDWAGANTLSTLWSCLAAHAAVLHLDGVQRRPLPVKCAGVFLCEQVADDPLMEGVPAMIRTPHSRRNALSASDLAARGYHLLTHSRDAGVDLFVRRDQSLFVFFQGHPEYDGDSLVKEYCRDLGRYLKGESPAPPAPPTGYLDADSEAAFQALTAQALNGPSEALAQRCAEIASGFQPTASWRPHATAIMRNWLHQISLMKDAQMVRAWPGTPVNEA